MFNASLKILKMLEKEGEMKISDISNLLPKKYNDHRDFYPLASLITQGFVEDSMLKKESVDQNPEYNTLKLQLLTWKLFATSNAKNNAEYKGHKWMIAGVGENFSDQLYSLTGAGYLYLEETRNKTNDRHFTFLIAIFSAIFASFLTYYMGKIN